MNIFCYFGLHKINDTSKIRVNKITNIYVLPEHENGIGTEFFRQIKIDSGHCKWCGHSIDKIISNEDIHIGI